MWITPLDFLIRVYYTLYMKVINNTGYDTKQLRTLFARCLGEVRKREGARWQIQKQAVNVIYQRKSLGKSAEWIGGEAFLRSNYLTMKLPHEKFEKTIVQDKANLDFTQCIADTYIHEIGHCFGQKHIRVEGYPARSTMEHLYREWILENISEEKYPITKK